MDRKVKFTKTSTSTLAKNHKNKSTTASDVSSKAIIGNRPLKVVQNSVGLATTSFSSNGESSRICAGCNKPVDGENKELQQYESAKLVMALDRIWHSEHFRCSHCKKELGSSFFKHPAHSSTTSSEIGNIKVYCPEDYYKLFGETCAGCQLKIKVSDGPGLTAKNRKWHVKCFKCDLCKRPVSGVSSQNRNQQQSLGGSFIEKEDKVYCKTCYSAKMANTCHGCDQVIQPPAQYISALSHTYHSTCFKCCVCQTNLIGGVVGRGKRDGGDFYESGGEPYCQKHHMELMEIKANYPICSSCDQPIKSGQRVITAMKRKFHPHHFTCTYCMKPLLTTVSDTSTSTTRTASNDVKSKKNVSTFKEKDDKPYCHECFHKLFA